MREFERFSTACANAYVQPLMSRHLTALGHDLKAAGFNCPLFLMLSGGGITTRNVKKIVALTGAREIHMSCRRSVDSGMTHRNSRVSMGGTLGPPEYGGKVADAAGIAGVLRDLGR